MIRNNVRINYGRVLLFSAAMQIRETNFAGPALVVMVVQPVAFMLIAMGGVANDRSPEAVTTVAAGVTLTALWSATIWGAASVLRRDRQQGTLSRALNGVVDVRVVVAGRGLGSTLVSLIVVIAAVAGVALFSGRRLAEIAPDALALAFILALLSGSALGLLVGSLFVASRFGAQLSAALTYPVYILGGMLIPPDELPLPFRWASLVVSFRWIQAILTAGVHGRIDWTAVLAATCLTAAYGLLGWLIFARLVDRGRREATLDLS